MKKINGKIEEKNSKVLIEEKKEMRKSKKFYISGFILVFISLFLFLANLIIGFIKPIEDLSKDYYLFIILGLGIIFLIVGFILLRKGNKMRMEEELKENNDFKEKLDEIINKKK